METHEMKLQNYLEARDTFLATRISMMFYGKLSEENEPRRYEQVMMALNNAREAWLEVTERSIIDTGIILYTTEEQ